jgi:kynurenine formamidase
VIDAGKLVDLSYTFDEKTVYWPNAEGFRHRKDSWKQTAAGYWYAAGEFTSAEHGGTHIDAPIHFSAGKQTLDQIPLAKLAAGSIVVIRTGWGKHWPDRKQYLGSDVKGDVANLHFPGLSREAAQLLVDLKVAGVGIDTASLDYGPSTDFIAHQILNGANIYGIENVANADKLPLTGATLIVMPMKIGEGSGGPARVVALLTK